MFGRFRAASARPAWRLVRTLPPTVRDKPSPRERADAISAIFRRREHVCARSDVPARVKKVRGDEGEEWIVRGESRWIILGFWDWKMEFGED